MATRPAIFPRALLGVALTLTLACGGDDEESPVVARVGEETITVEDVAGYMQRANYGANLQDVERAVNEMIDAHLVLERARERYDPAPVESLQMAEWRNTLLVNQFREDVIWRDIAVDEARLQEWYDQNVGEQVTVDHILIRAQTEGAEAPPDGAPGGASGADAQAARQKADSLHAAIEDGADFAELARQHSDDQSSASRGGRMNPFGRGDMVAPFEQAAFETPVGELAPVVESRFGYHILRVVEREKPELDEMREEIEAQLARPMRNEAEDRYITNLMETSGLEFFERNIDTFLAMLEEGRPPTAEERELDLATYDGGRITLGEIWGLYEVLPAGNRQAIAQLDQQGLIQALASMAQQKIMIARAEEAGTVLDSVRQGQLDERVDQLLLSSYLRSASEARLEVGDEEARQYYEEHREFYADRPFEEVAQEIRQVLASQRLEELSSADVQRATLAAIADSQEGATEVVRNTETYDEVLAELRRLRSERGTPDPGTASGGRLPGGRMPGGQAVPGQAPGQATGQAPGQNPAGTPPDATPVPEPQSAP